MTEALRLQQITRVKIIFYLVCWEDIVYYSFQCQGLVLWKSKPINCIFLNKE